MTQQEELEVAFKWAGPRWEEDEMAWYFKDRIADMNADMDVILSQLASDEVVVAPGIIYKREVK